MKFHVFRRFCALRDLNTSKKCALLFNGLESKIFENKCLSYQNLSLFKNNFVVKSLMSLNLKHGGKDFSFQIIKYFWNNVKLKNCKRGQLQHSS